MGFIGKQPTSAPLTASDITDGIISNAKLGADSVNSSKISDDSISDEHLDITSITGHSEKTSLVDADKFLISDSAASGALKYVQNSNLAGGTHIQVGTVHYETSQSTHAATLSNCFSSTYDHYVLYLYLLPATNSASIEMDVLNDSGGNINSLFNYSARYFDSDGSSGSHTGQSTNHINLGSVSSNPRDGGLGGVFHFHINKNHSSTSQSGTFRSTGFYSSVASNNDQTQKAYYFGGYYRQTGDNDSAKSLKFAVSTGNLEQVSMKMYGLKGSDS